MLSFIIPSIINVELKKQPLLATHLMHQCEQCERECVGDIIWQATFLNVDLELIKSWCMLGLA